MSRVAWLDYSEDQRRRMREVIDLFREHDTLDELGVGSIRDTLSDLLFPGTSTVQTRARYLLFLPWIYLDIERRKVPSDQARKEARRLQTKLIYAMEAGGAGAGEGIIGWDARETLQRLPSDVYWGGLSTFGIRHFHGSIEDYHRSLDGFQRRTVSHARGDGDELHERFQPNWHAGLPTAPDNLFKETSIRMRPQDADFLRERILMSRPRSLLAHLLRQAPMDTDAATPWDHPHAASAPEPLPSWIDHARRFSAVMHGAALAYNLMLANLAVERGMSGDYERWAEEYQIRLGTWAGLMSSAESPVTDWDFAEFWLIVEEANPRLRVPTRAFVDRWLDLARNSLEAITQLDQNVQDHIRRRERMLKGSQARLDSARALERWSGAAGTRPLDYRWPVTSQIIADIQEAQSDA